MVTSRQLERQREREKERAQTHLREVEEKHKEEVTKLEKRLHDVERDRNLLLVSGDVIIHALSIMRL